MNLIALRYTLPRVQAASRWKWDEGLEYFFWIYPEGYQDQARDGVRIFIKEAPPRWIKTQRQEKDIVVREKVADKLSKLGRRGYTTRSWYPP